MGERPTLSLEFGALERRPIECSWIDPSVKHARIAQEMKDVQANVREMGVDLKLLPYEGGEGILLSGGGRQSAYNALLRVLIQTYNRAGFGFMVAMNGGTILNPEVEFDIVNDARFDVEMRVLQILNDSAREHGVKNWVTIYRDELLGVIKEHFPELGTIASCIRFAGRAEGHFQGLDEYRRALENFDRVCPLNQHTTPEFIGQFDPDSMDRWLLLASSDCARANIKRCLHHYREVVTDKFFDFQSHELIGACRQDHQTGSSPEVLSIIPPSTDFPVARPKACFHSSGQLISRPTHLERFMQMGVHQFKLPRNSGNHHFLEDVSVNILVRSFLDSHQRPR